MTDAVREAERAEIVASNNLAHAFQNTPRNSDAIGALGIFVAKYRDAVAARAVAARDAAWRKAVARVRMLHSASCLRWIRNDDSQPCSCDDTTKIHNAALDALLDAMEGK